MSKGQFLKEVGKNVRSVRKAKKITLAELSKECGINIIQLSFLENDKCNSHIPTLKNIAEVLGTTVKEFIA